jgi:peptide/nickel transport system substrate-binding protein
LALVGIVAGSALLASAAHGLEGPRGGTLRVDVPGTVRFVDPTLSTTWQLMHATHLQLLGYPDAEAPAGTRLQPEAAGLPAISRDGKTYTFRIRPGFRFSDGKPVTAASFALSIERARDPRMDAYAATYVRDVVRVAARGNTLTITLRAPAPDFLSRISLPHFPALPEGFPLVPEGVSEAPLHSAGPYYLKEYVAGRSALLARNPYWRRSLLPRRPANVDQIQFSYGITPATALGRVERGESDLTPVANALVADVYNRYGLNKGRFFVRRGASMWMVAFNNSRSAFADPQLRRAVNYAIDRAHLTRQFGLLAGTRTDQLLTPSIAGFRDVKIYPIAGAEVQRAQQLARGHTGDGKAVLYTNSETVGPALAEIVRFNLRQIGLDVEVRTYSSGVLFERIARADEPYDAVILNWFVDYPDPSNIFVNLLRNDAPRFRDPVFDKRIDAALKLTGEARYATFARIDRDLMRERPPVAPIVITNSRSLLSAQTGCFVFQPAMAVPDLAALCKR